MALTSPAIRRICQCLYLLRMILSVGSSRPFSPFPQARRPRGALAIGGGRIRAVGDAVLAIAARASMDGRERNQVSWTTLDDGASGARPKPMARSAGAWSKSLAACTRPGAGAGCFPSFPFPYAQATALDGPSVERAMDGASIRPGAGKAGSAGPTSPAA